MVSKTKKKHNRTRKYSIYILYTGGTIGMSHSARSGLIPKRHLFNDLVRDLHIPKYVNVAYKIDTLPEVIDSSNIQSRNWLEILRNLKANYSKYDSFIIIHGTDTLSYTASLLSFFCKDWTKTIIVTGSQVPMFEFRNDAVKNIRDSIILSLYSIPQVLIVFGGSILRANCTTKYSSTSFQAYRSPNIEPLGEFGVSLNLDYSEIQKGIVPKNRFIKKHLPNSIRVDDWHDDINILVITLVPGMTWKDKISSVFASGIPRAIILRSYGIGNAPVASDDFIAFLNLAGKHNIIVVNSTQCYDGGVNMDYYETGRVLLEYGVVDPGIMTFEAIYTKLFYLFQVLEAEDAPLIKKLFITNIAGEITRQNRYTNLRKTIKKINRRMFYQYQEL